MRLTHLVLASLLLIAQLASPVMQLCLEEDGRVSVELASRDCRPSTQEQDDEGCKLALLRSDSASSHACEFAHEESCPCSDYGVSLVVSGSRDWISITFDLPTEPLLGLPIPSHLLVEGTPAHLVPANGQLSLAWLEHADVLAKHHAAHAVVMNC
ncbi:MAG: hypothetical protein QM477_11525 [Planctomycetota bacterium]